MNKLWYVIFGLAAIIILLLIFQPSPPPPDTTAWQDEIWRKELRIRQLTALNEYDSIASAQKLAELRDSLAKEQKHGLKLSVSLAHYKAKPEVVKIVQANPVIDTVFQYYDSLLQSKDQQLAIHDSKILVLEDENKRITANFMERLQLTEENYLAQKAITEDYRKGRRKDRRAIKALKVAVVVGTVGGIFVGSQF